MALNFSWMTEHPVLLIRPRFLGRGIGEEQDCEGCCKATDGVSYNFTSCITAFNY